VRHKSIFPSIYALTLAAVTLIGIEAMASLYSPSWPARALRSAEPVNVEFRSFADKPWMEEPFNTWLDRERTFDRPPGVSFRTVFVGDSFLEHMPTNRSLPAAVRNSSDALGKNRPRQSIWGSAALAPLATTIVFATLHFACRLTRWQSPSSQAMTSCATAKDLGMVCCRL